MKRQHKFFLTLAAALVWLLFSAVLAVPWIRQASLSLPLGYVVWAVGGIALLPGYLMCAMFLSNLLNRKLPTAAPALRLPVTVLLCARNEAPHIYRTLQALAAQQYGGCMEVLCVDNGSTDCTCAEIRRAAAALGRPDFRIRLLQCPQPGKAHALNLGLAHVRTRCFITVDADTCLEKTAVNTILHRLTASGAACVAGNLLVGRAQSWVQRMQVYDYAISIAAIKRYQGSCGSTLVAQGAFSAYDTRAVRGVGGWTQCAGEDIVLTYRLLATGRCSLYEPRAVGYTLAPETLPALCRQRTRWARGMLEGLRAVKPWQQAAMCSGYFETLNVSILYLDLAYVFGFLAGVILALLGWPLLVGWLTLLVLPLTLIGIFSVYDFQRRIPAVHIRHSLLGFLCYLVLFQPVQSLCSLTGYWQALTGRRLHWKT